MKYYSTLKITTMNGHFAQNGTRSQSSGLKGGFFFTSESRPANHATHKRYPFLVMSYDISFGFTTSVSGQNTFNLYDFGRFQHALNLRIKLAPKRFKKITKTSFRAFFLSQNFATTFFWQQRSFSVLGELGILIP